MGWRGGGGGLGGEGGGTVTREARGPRGWRVKECGVLSRGR